MKKKRSISIIIFGCLFILKSILWLGVLLIVVYMAIIDLDFVEKMSVGLDKIAQDVAEEKELARGDFEGIYGILHYSNQLFEFISGIAILLLKNWGRVLILVFSMIELISLLLRIFMGYNSLGIMTGSFIIFYLSAIYFFTRPKVKEQFK